MPITWTDTIDGICITTAMAIFDDQARATARGYIEPV